MFFYKLDSIYSIRQSSGYKLRAPIAPQVLGSTRQQNACGDFVNLEDLSAQSSKMLLGVGFACVYSQG
jgi:hypothetical protein